MGYQPDEAGNNTSDPLDWGTPNEGNKEYLSHEQLALLGGVDGLCSLCSLQTHSVELYSDASNQTCCQTKLNNSQLRKCQGSGHFIRRFSQYWVQTRLLLGLFLEIIVSSHTCCPLVTVQGTVGVEALTAGIGVMASVGSCCIRPGLKRSAT